VDERGKPLGIARVVTGDWICEGEYKFFDVDRQARANGLVRFIENDYYYIGIMRDERFNGKGKKVYASGRVEEGIWKDDVLVSDK
jgi:hypothetical protein